MVSLSVLPSLGSKTAMIKVLVKKDVKSNYKLGPFKAKAPCGIHALTGCDTPCHLIGRFRHLKVNEKVERLTPTAGSAEFKSQARSQPSLRGGSAEGV